MKHTLRRRLLAATLGAILLLTGCSAAAQNDHLREAGEGQLVLVDRGEDASGSYASERPSALDESALANVSIFAPAVTASTTAGSNRVSVDGEIRAVWISYLEMETLLKNKTSAQFTTNMQAVFDNCKEFGLNTVIVQVRPFGDALYNSAYYPWSYTVTGTEGRNPGFDPLEIMVREAHSRGLRIEAWINPYRVRAAGNSNALSANNQAQIWLNSGDSAVIHYNGVISYNPASAKARQLIVNGAVEIVNNYSIDGIHIDDYFYPTTDSAFDQSSYTAYTNAGGTMSRDNWRRNNVETLVKAMYDGIKAADPTVTFGISPQSSVANNYSQQYLDVEKIAATAGYCDYICPQVYFGFENGTQPYRETVEQWDRIVDNAVVDLYIGIAAYKCGGVDSWAGNGAQEWVSNNNLLRQMVECARNQSSYAGFVVYRYDSMFNPASDVSSHVSREASNLKAILN